MDDGRENGCNHGAAQGLCKMRMFYATWGT